MSLSIMKESTATSEKSESVSSFSSESEDNSFSDKSAKEREKRLQEEHSIDSRCDQCEHLMRDNQKLMQELEKERRKNVSVAKLMQESEKQGGKSLSDASKHSMSEGNLSPRGNKEALTDLLESSKTNQLSDSSSSFTIVDPVKKTNSEKYSGCSGSEVKCYWNDEHQTVLVTTQPKREEMKGKESHVETSALFHQLSQYASQSPEGNLVLPVSKHVSNAYSSKSYANQNTPVVQVESRAAKSEVVTAASPQVQQNFLRQAEQRSVHGSCTDTNTTLFPPSSGTTRASVGLSNGEVSTHSPAQQKDILNFAKSQTQPGVSFLPSSSVYSWGIGARPKDTNPLEWQPINTTSYQESKVCTKLQGSQAAPEGKVDLLSSMKGQLSLNNFSVSTNESGPSMNMTVPSDAVCFNIPTSATSQTTSISDGDLMTFVNLELTPNLVNKNSTSESMFNKQSNPVVMVASDEQEHQLSTQAHSMVEQLQKGEPHPTGMSQLLYQFAEKVALLEKKYNENQSLIQRQQVQIQSFTQQNNTEELKRLKLQNEQLMALLKNQSVTSTSAVGSCSSKSKTEKQEASAQAQSASLELKRIEELTHTNEQLYKANKDWHNRWQSLQQNAQKEKQKLEVKITSLTAENDHLKVQLGALEQHVDQMKSTKLKNIQKTFDRDQEILNLGRELEMTKTQYEDVVRLKEKLEAENVSLKTRGSRESKQHSKSSGSTNMDVELLKQQLAVFHEDFQKEREDRSKAEGKVEKMRKERDSARMEQTATMKKMQGLLNTREAELKNKAKQLSEMQQQIGTLKKELQKERQKSSANVQHHTPLAGQHVMYTGAGQRTVAEVTTPKDKSPTRQSTHHQVSPEHLPNAWQCRECTFMNFPERSVCDICGWQNSFAELSSGGMDSTIGLPELKIRGELMNDIVTDEPDDVMTDTG